ncbi:MAG TPA: gamma carbonic anhydrase family protein [Thermodesulfobacteriota bacterium]|nr:gamma carbonic anhydrase family protein [Thermodesulfobacteriota bacterium]
MILPLDGHAPVIAPSAYVDPTAEVAGRVTVGDEASLWYHVVARADLNTITIGPRTNIQDGCILHVDSEWPVVVGADVTVGHGAILHGCRIGDGALIGIGAIVLSGAEVGAGAIVAAGSLVPEGEVIPPGVVAMGTPARPRRELTDAERERLRRGIRNYLDLARRFRAARGGPASRG